MSPPQTKQLTINNEDRLDYLIKKSMEEILSLHKMFKDDLSASISGGKDSLVMGHLVVRTLGRGVPFNFQDTHIEFKETKETLFKAVDVLGLTDFNILHPYSQKSSLVHQIKRRAKNTIKKHGKDMALFIVAKKRPCCDSLKKHVLKRYMKKRGLVCSIDGRRREESNQRSSIKCLIDPLQGSPDLFTASPLRDWTQEDIWRYIKREGLPINPIYNNYIGCGCAPCPCPNKAYDYYSILANHHPRWYKWIWKLRPERPRFYKHTWLSPEEVEAL